MLHMFGQTLVDRIKAYPLQRTPSHRILKRLSAPARPKDQFCSLTLFSQQPSDDPSARLPDIGIAVLAQRSVKVDSYNFHSVSPSSLHIHPFIFDALRALRSISTTAGSLHRAVHLSKIPQGVLLFEIKHRSHRPFYTMKISPHLPSSTLDKAPKQEGFVYASFSWRE